MPKDCPHKVKESEIQKAILSYLGFKGYLARKMPLGSMMVSNGGFAKHPLKGFPDIFGILKNRKGVMFCIEVKTAEGKLRKEQKEWISLLESQNVPCLVARSLEDIITWLEIVDR